MSSSSALPRHFGPYALLASLGRGGMGEVYLARHGQLVGAERLCVLKTLRQDLSQDPEYLGRFLDEARVVVQLSHANVCHVFDAGRVDDELYLAMEYIPGVNLRHVVSTLDQRGMRLAPGLALHVASEILEALDYAHRLTHRVTGAPLRLVHRDVSPHNIMVSFEGETKLIDFGLAESTLKEEHTATQQVLGKVAYMSPEQARGDAVDAATDQFAAAVMLTELLLHERFYGTMTTHQIWQIVGVGGYRPARWSEIPTALQPILARALDPDPAQRFPSCDALRDALDAYRARAHPGTGRKDLRVLLHDIFPRLIAETRGLVARAASIEVAPTASELSSPTAVERGRRLNTGSMAAPHGLADAAPSPAPNTALPSTGDVIGPPPPDPQTYSGSSALPVVPRSIVDDERRRLDARDAATPVTSAVGVAPPGDRADDDAATMTDDGGAPISAEALKALRDGAPDLARTRSGASPSSIGAAASLEAPLAPDDYTRTATSVSDVERIWQREGRARETTDVVARAPAPAPRGGLRAAGLVAGAAVVVVAAWWMLRDGASPDDAPTPPPVIDVRPVDPVPPTPPDPRPPVLEPTDPPPVDDGVVDATDPAAPDPGTPRPPRGDRRRPKPPPSADPPPVTPDPPPPTPPPVATPDPPRPPPVERPRALTFDEKIAVVRGCKSLPGPVRALVEKSSDGELKTKGRQLVETWAQKCAPAPH